MRERNSEDDNVSIFKHVTAGGFRRALMLARISKRGGAQKGGLAAWNTAFVSGKLPGAATSRNTFLGLRGPRRTPIPLIGRGGGAEQ